MIYTQSEATASLRRFYLYLVDATDGITPETGEAAGQPQISKAGGAFSNTTATLTAIGNGSYYVELTATELNTVGGIVVRYKSAATAEFSAPGQVVVPSLTTAGTGFPAVDASQRVDVGLIRGQVLTLSGNVVTFPFGVLLQPTAESTVALNIRGGAAATGLWIRGGNYAATPDVTGSGLVIGTGADSGNDGVHRAIVLNKGATPTDAMSADGGLNAVLATVTTATNVTNLPSIPANWLTAAGTASDFGTEIADAVLSRSVATVESTAAEHTLATAILAMLENTISGTTLTIRRSDGTTTHYTKTLTTDPAAEPITGIQ